MTKAPDAFRTISEVAEDLDLPQHVLRFWETRFNQIKPMKRGGGRRYYRPEDVDLLRGIRLLLYAEGFTIRGVQRLLKEKGVGYVAAVGQTGSVQAASDAPVPDMDRDLEPLDWPEDDESEAESPEEPETVAPQASARPALDARTDPGFAPSPGSGLEAEAAPRPGLMREPQPAPGLSQSDRRRLEAALADLVEAKRLLDGVR